MPSQEIFLGVLKSGSLKKRIIKSGCNSTEIYLQYNPPRFDRPANLYAADDSKKKCSLQLSQMNSLGLKVRRYEYKGKPSGYLFLEKHLKCK